MKRFNTLVQDTIELGEDYLQKTKDTQNQTYGLTYKKESRYSEPVTLTQDVEQEQDIDQLITDAEENGLKQLRKRLNS